MFENDFFKEDKYKDVIPIHPNIKEFWSGADKNIYFFHQELMINPYVWAEECNPRYHLLYWCSINCRYHLVAGTFSYPAGNRPPNIKYEIYYLYNCHNQGFYHLNMIHDQASYSEEEMLRIIKLKCFL